MDSEKPDGQNDKNLRCTTEGLPVLLRETIESYIEETERPQIGSRSHSALMQGLSIIKKENPELHKYIVEVEEGLRGKLGDSTAISYTLGAVETYVLLTRQKQVNDLDEEKCP